MTVFNKDRALIRNKGSQPCGKIIPCGKEKQTSPISGKEKMIQTGKFERKG